jgi:hypothetical protein
MIDSSCIICKIPRVNLLDETELRQVFFGEGSSDISSNNNNHNKSYCVLCHDESSTLPLSSVFLDAHKENKSPALFRVVDCQYVLPSSEKTIAERFKLDLTKRPTIFVSGNVGEPRQVRMIYIYIQVVFTLAFHPNAFASSPLVYCLLVGKHMYVDSNQTLEDG